MRTAAVVAELAARDYQVTVATALPSFPTGVVDKPFRGRLFVRQQLQNIRVLRLWTYASSRLSKLDRILNWLTFALSLMVYLFIQRQRFDLIYATVGPISLMPLAVLAKRLHRAPLVADVRDVLPDRAIHLRLWRENGPTTRIVGFIAKWFYGSADLISTVNSICREEIMSRYDEPQKIIIFPNGFDAVVPAAAPPFQRHDEEFVATYAGNIGQTSGVDVILDAAQQLRTTPRFRFVIIGGGNESAMLEARIKKESIDNVVMLGVRSPEDTAAAQLASDLCIIPLRRDVIDTIPKKLYDALGLGRPVIVCANGLAKRFINEAGGGICIEPQDGAELARTIQRLADDPQTLRRYARSGQAFVLGGYNRARQVQEFANNLVSLNGKR